MVKPSYKEVGFAVVNGVLNGEETTLVVQMFGASAAAPVAEAPQTTPAPVIIPEEAASKVSAAEPTVAPAAPVPSALSGYQDVTRQPVINIPTVSRNFVFAFMGILMGILLVDALVARRKHVVRIAGHNIAHIMFLVAFFIIISAIGRGSLL